jgi:hypothetical protein
MSSNVIVQPTQSRGPAKLWPLATLPTSAFIVWSSSTGGEALRWLGLSGMFAALAVPMLASLEAGLIAMMIFEPLRGLLRRAQYIFLTYTQSDPIHVITPLITLLALTALLQRRKLQILTETPFAKLVSILALIYFLQIFNPLQGGLAVGFSGALFILVPMAWFYFGAEVKPDFMRKAMVAVVVLAMLTSLYGLYHLAVGFPAFEQYWLDHTDAYESISVGKIQRALATFSSAEEWGRYIQVAAIIAFGFGAGTTHKLHKAGWFFCGGALSVMLLFTGQRTAIFGLSLGVVGLIVLGARSLGSGVARVAVVLTPILLIALLAKAPTNDDVMSRSDDDKFGTVLSHSTRGALDPTHEDSLQERFKTWTYLATDVLPKNPLGMGIGATSLAVTRTDKSAALPPIDSYFISSVITCGLPAAILFLVILIRATQVSWKRVRHSSDAQMTQVWRVIAALMPALILNSLFGNTFTLYSVAPVGWLIVGWISAQHHREIEKEALL